MKRNWHLLRDEPSDEAAYKKAVALAEQAGAEFIASCTELKVLLDRIGGQIYVTAYRRKISDDGEVIPVEEEAKTPGRWETIGYAIHYESRDRRIEDFGSPVEAANGHVDDLPEPASPEDEQAPEPAAVAA